MRTEKITNIDELVNFLCDLLIDERNGTVDIKSAVEMNNTAGKIINAAKVKILYLQIQKTLDDSAKQIPFLEAGLMTNDAGKRLQNASRDG